MVDISLNDQTGNRRSSLYHSNIAKRRLTKCSSNSNFITWSSGNTSGTYKVEQSLNGGSTRSIASSVSGNSRHFTAPSTMSTQAKIRVSDAVDATKSDESDAVFSIVDLPSPVTLLTPILVRYG